MVMDFQKKNGDYVDGLTFIRQSNGDFLLTVKTATKLMKKKKEASASFFRIIQIRRDKYANFLLQ